MRRRLDLAAALVARPPVLFLDEPTTGLDPRSRIALWEVLEARVAAGTTVLLTTQYLDEADRLADRIAVIDRGTVIAEGTSDELKARVGGEQLEVVLEDPARAGAAACRAGADRGRAAERPRRHRRRTTARAARRDRRGRPAARRRGGRCGRPLAEPAHARRRLPGADRPRGGAGRGRGGRRGHGRGRVVSALACAVSDTVVLARRNLLRIPRQPDLLISFTIQPIMFVLLFVYVFGGAIQPGFDCPSS
jgi:hypothetical protein